MTQQIFRIVYGLIVEIFKPPDHFQVWRGLKANTSRGLRREKKPKHVAQRRVHRPSILLSGDVRKWTKAEWPGWENSDR
jgi:hypothetical protein